MCGREHPLPGSDRPTFSSVPSPSSRQTRLPQYRNGDREKPRGSPLPHHRTYRSVSGGSDRTRKSTTFLEEAHESHGTQHLGRHRSIHVARPCVPLWAPRVHGSSEGARLIHSSLLELLVARSGGCGQNNFAGMSSNRRAEMALLPCRSPCSAGISSTAKTWNWRK